MTAKAVTREYALVALGRYTLNATFFSVRSFTEGFSIGSYPLPAVNKITSRQKESPPPSKDASPQLSDAVARILVLRASCGILGSFENF